MTFEEEKALADRGYVPTFSEDGSRISGWYYPIPNNMFTVFGITRNGYHCFTVDKISIRKDQE